MASSDAAFSLFKTLFVPAIISLLIFLALTFVVMPVWRRYRGRYGQYLTLGSLSERTSSLRHLIVGRFAGLAPLATYLGARAVVFPPRALAGAEDADGEELNDVDEAMWRAIERHVPAARSDSTRRLIRDLEEGFMDDSDDESWPEGPTIIARRGR